MEDETALIDSILKENHTVAIVGLSDKPGRPSYIVGKYLKDNGFKITPVNPQAKDILGEVSYPDLKSIPFPVDVVDVFRRSEEVSAIVEDAIKIGAKVVWMQEGVIDDDAAERASKAGLKVVMDRCMRKQHLRMTGRRF